MSEAVGEQVLDSFIKCPIGGEQNTISGSGCKEELSLLEVVVMGWAVLDVEHMKISEQGPHAPVHWPPVC